MSIPHRASPVRLNSEIRLELWLFRVSQSQQRCRAVHVAKNDGIALLDNGAIRDFHWLRTLMQVSSLHQLLSIGRLQIVVHGTLRNAAVYFKSGRQAVADASAAGAGSLVTAPHPDIA